MDNRSNETDRQNDSWQQDALIYQRTVNLGNIILGEIEKVLENGSKENPNLSLLSIIGLTAGDARERICSILTQAGFDTSENLRKMLKALEAKDNFRGEFRRELSYEDYRSGKCNKDMLPTMLLFFIRDEVQKLLSQSDSTYDPRKQWEEKRIEDLQRRCKNIVNELWFDSERMDNHEIGKKWWATLNRLTDEEIRSGLLPPLKKICEECRIELREAEKQHDA